MRKILYALAAAGLIMSAPTLAAPCKDAKGKFTKCPPAKPVAKPKVCKDAKGKFAKCGSPGAKPV